MDLHRTHYRDSLKALVIPYKASQNQTQKNSPRDFFTVFPSCLRQEPSQFSNALADSVQQINLASSIRFATTNFNDPDASKPTLDIDPFAKAKRLNRPNAPHLSIYQPQITWYLSGFHRLTGFALTGVFYLGAMSYAVFPVDSAIITQSVHALPGIVLFGGKTLLASPLFFHSFNGIRHLVFLIH
jgi:hypothetical protein